MLTIKIMSAKNGEQIHTGKSVSFNPRNKRLAIVGVDQAIFLKGDEVAYVMNQTGKTVSVYYGKV